MKIIAIDLGLKRIGLAICADGSIVTPLPAIERKNRNQASQEVRAVLDEWGVEAVVVGIPMDGGESESSMRRRVAHFMKLVDFKGELFLQDESFSSVEAKSLMQGEMRQKRDGRIDSLSAKIILQRWLEEH